MNTVSGLIVDDQTVISEELGKLQSLLGQLDEQIRADRAALSVVETSEHVLDILPERHVVMVSGLSSVVVDREWASHS